MTKTRNFPTDPGSPTARSAASDHSHAEQQAALARRYALQQWLRQQRLEAPSAPTQMQLSKALGFSYSIVTAWENGARLITESHLRAWGAQLGLSGALLDERQLEAGDAVQSDEKTGIVTGSRMDAEVSGRMKWLRAELRLTLREFGDATGITAGHMQRIENNTSNLSISQLRSIHRRLHVNFEWLIEGTGHYNDVSLATELRQLRRENELLEGLRQAAQHLTQQSRQQSC